MATQKETLEQLFEEIEALKQRVAALESSDRTKPVVATPEINEYANDLSSKEQHRRSKALAKLRSMMHHEDARDVLVSALNSEHFEVLTQVLDALGSRKYAPARDRVIEIIEFNEEPEVRRRAALYLRRLGDEAAVPALVKALDDENEFVVSEAAQALETIGTEEALNSLEEWRLKA